MIIHRIRASGFQIIGDPIDLDFPEVGRIGIFGTNESGKTTLLEAIEYALYGIKRGRGTETLRENIITWGKDEANVEVEFTSGQERYLLRRSFNIRGTHHARLTSNIDGHQDAESALTNLTEIETKIEQITGMDRDSFTKLVYIKQKDLDALKTLGSTKREQLIDKVMGIEIFDEAAKRVKADTVLVEQDIGSKETSLIPVRANAKSFQDKLEFKNGLQADLTNNLEPHLKEKKQQFSVEETVLATYAWLFAFKSKVDLVASMKNEQGRVKNDVDRLVQLRKDEGVYQAAVTTYKPELDRLNVASETFSRLESELSRSTQELERLNAARGEALHKVGLDKGGSSQFERSGLQRKKGTQLAQFMITLILSVALIVGGMLIQPIVSILGFVLAAVTAGIYLRYRKTDAILSLTSEIGTLDKHIETTLGTIHDEQGKVTQYAATIGFSNQAEVQGALTTNIDHVKQVTGQPTMERVEANLLGVKDEIKRLIATDPEGHLASLSHSIKEKEQERDSLEQSQPAAAADLQYNEASHTEAQSKTERLRGEFEELARKHAGAVATIKQLETELSQLKGDFDRLPNLEAEYATLQGKKTVMEMVTEQLGETSKKLRNQVMPYAGLLINQLLPILTDGRYSQFEIAEDLKFKAHSNEAGGFKEREIFSGGTQDQFLIALRLAFTQSILDSRVMADKYCLLMDECISSSDYQRRQGIFEVLDVTKKTFSQVFVIAHEDISNLTDHNLSLSRNSHGYTEVRSKSW
jgi:exonuclease SbcC